MIKFWTPFQEPEVLFDPNTVAAFLRFSYFDHFQTLFPVVVLTQHRNNECFQACVWYYYYIYFLHLFLSCGLLHHFSVTLSPSVSLISGSAMNVVYGEEEMKRFLEEATQVSQVRSELTLCVSVHVREMPPFIVQSFSCFFAVTCFYPVSLSSCFELAQAFSRQSCCLSLLPATPRWQGDPWLIQWLLPGVNAPKQGC